MNGNHGFFFNFCLILFLVVCLSTFSTTVMGNDRVPIRSVEFLVDLSNFVVDNPLDEFQELCYDSIEGLKTDINNVGSRGSVIDEIANILNIVLEVIVLPVSIIFFFLKYIFTVIYALLKVIIHILFGNANYV